MLLNRMTLGKTTRFKRIASNPAGLSYTRAGSDVGLRLSVQQDDTSYTYSVTIGVDELNRALEFMERIGVLHNNRVIEKKD